MKNITIVTFINALILLTGCASKEERLLEMQQEHELKMKKLEIRSNQSGAEKATDTILDVIDENSGKLFGLF